MKEILVGERGGLSFIFALLLGALIVGTTGNAEAASI